MNQQNKTERWEEEFDRRFPTSYAGLTIIPMPIEAKAIKSFITQLLSDARREEREKALNEAKELLTSDIYKEKYREILKEARAEAIRSCLEALPEKMIIDYYFSPGPDERAEYKKGFNQAISAAEERIKNLK